LLEWPGFESADLYDSSLVLPFLKNHRLREGELAEDPAKLQTAFPFAINGVTPNYVSKGRPIPGGEKTGKFTGINRSGPSSVLEGVPSSY
jgi:hypothetical protein